MVEQRMAKDLMDMDLRKRRSQAKVTVLKKPEGETWSTPELDSLIGCLMPMAMLHINPAHPIFLMIRGEYPRGRIAELVGGTEFEYSVIEGLDNPDLPFEVPML